MNSYDRLYPIDPATGLRIYNPEGQRVVNIEDLEMPETDLCIYCTSEPVDPAHAPYCGVICAIHAENDNVD